MTSSHHDFKSRIFCIQNEDEFENVALEIFRYQAVNNPLYKQYLTLTGADIEGISTVEEIRFLPISFFKSNKIITGTNEAEVIFHSSGTGGDISQHFITDVSLYTESLTRGFMHFYGAPSDYVFILILPSYQQNPHSSLISMTNQLVELSGHELSGYYNPDDDLQSVLDRALKSKRKIFLWGVTYALLQLAEKRSYSGLTENDVVMETGGMKGRGKERTRQEIHSILTKAFSVQKIHSEYGMSELLSQAYSTGQGLFKTVPWMKILCRDVYDPFDVSKASGALNIIDLANVNSCSFIATDDLGRLHNDGFEITGRLDYSDLRGCNLLNF